jgi:hypothetical protein
VRVGCNVGVGFACAPHARSWLGPCLGFRSGIEAARQALQDFSIPLLPVPAARVRPLHCTYRGRTTHARLSAPRDGDGGGGGGGGGAVVDGCHSPVAHSFSYQVCTDPPVLCSVGSRHPSRCRRQECTASGAQRRVSGASCGIPGAQPYALTPPTLFRLSLRCPPPLPHPHPFKPLPHAPRGSGGVRLRGHARARAVLVGRPLPGRPLRR